MPDSNGTDRTELMIDMSPERTQPIGCPDDANGIDGAAIAFRAICAQALHYGIGGWIKQAHANLHSRRKGFALLRNHPFGIPALLTVRQSLGSKTQLGRQEAVALGHRPLGAF